MRLHRHLVLFIAFMSGFVLMALEMIGFRVLAPYFGNSVYVWGNLIGVVLIAMSGGYLVGGKLADARRKESDLYFLLLISGVYTLFVIFTYQYVLRWLSQYGDLWGSFWAGTFLLAFPIFLLSFVTPYIIALISKQENVGFSVGIVNFINTIGNILGIYGAIFIFIPYLGIRFSFIVCFILLVVMAVLGLVYYSKKFLLILFIVLIAFLIPDGTLPAFAVAEDESLYNHITIYERNNATYLVLNNDRAIQSMTIAGSNLTGYYFDLYLLLPSMAQERDTLILGMGAGSTIKLIQENYPNVNVDAIELDGKVVEYAKEYFDIEQSEQLFIDVDDGRMFLKHSDKKYGAIAVDIFQGSLHIPFYVLTQEFFTQVSDDLYDDGYMFMNVYTQSPELWQLVSNTIASVFPGVYFIQDGDNRMVIATKSGSNVPQILGQVENQQVREILARYNYQLRQKIFDESIGVLTDDKAPVEQYMRDY